MYKTLEEKAQVFNQKTIKSIKELNSLIKEKGKNPKLRFRGVSKSEYCMLTSLQRKCIDLNNSQKEYFSKILKEVKELPELDSFFKKKGIHPNDISYMALMQHYGLPTPFLDFSTDINIALSFAAENVSLTPVNKETDDYVSLYVIDIDGEEELKNSLQILLNNDMETGVKYATTLAPSIDVSLLHEIDKFVTWDDMKNIELLFIEYQLIAPSVVTLSDEALDLSNPNLCKQKGCFILNLYDENTPLEKNWNMRLPQSINKYWENFNCQNLPFRGFHTKRKIRCYDISKKAIKEWANRNKKESLYDISEESVIIKEKLSSCLPQ